MLFISEKIISTSLLSLRRIRSKKKKKCQKLKKKKCIELKIQIMSSISDSYTITNAKFIENKKYKCEHTFSTMS